MLYFCRSPLTAHVKKALQDMEVSKAFWRPCGRSSQHTQQADPLFSDTTGQLQGQSLPRMDGGGKRSSTQAVPNKQCSPVSLDTCPSPKLRKRVSGPTQHLPYSCKQQGASQCSEPLPAVQIAKQKKPVQSVPRQFSTASKPSYFNTGEWESIVSTKSDTAIRQFIENEQQLQEAFSGNNASSSKEP